MVDYYTFIAILLTSIDDIWARTFIVIINRAW